MLPFDISPFRNQIFGKIYTCLQKWDNAKGELIAIVAVKTLA